MSEADDLKARLPEIRDKWLKIGKSCEPANRAEAEAGMRKAYQQIGEKPPPMVLWFDSPMAGALAASIVQTIYNAEKAKRGIKEIKDPADIPQDIKDLVLTETPKQVAALMKKLLTYPVSKATISEVQKVLHNSPSSAVWGQHDAGWLAYYDVLEVFDKPKAQGMEGLIEVAMNAGWWWPFRECVIMTDRPAELHLDNQERVHNENGFGFGYRDGWGLYAWHGIRVPRWVVMDVSVQKIVDEQDVEIRRCAIESMGWDRFVLEAGLKLLHEQDDPGNFYPDGTPKKIGLYDVPSKYWGDSVRVLLCVNGTPERDGTFHRFGLTVPVDCKTALEAASWGYNVSPEDYAKAQRRC